MTGMDLLIRKVDDLVSGQQVLTVKMRQLEDEVRLGIKPPGTKSFPPAEMLGPPKPTRVIDAEKLSRLNLPRRRKDSRTEEVPPVLTQEAPHSVEQAPPLNPSSTSSKTEQCRDQPPSRSHSPVTESSEEEYSSQDDTDIQLHLRDGDIHAIHFYFY